MVGQTKLYSDLKPPSNPDYPWKGEGWQPLCYYCNQPIEMSKPWAGVKQRVIWNWEHVNPATTGNKHIKGSKWHCDPAKLRPTQDIDDPRCHCGAQEADKHRMTCSAAGKPSYHATPFSSKEEELIRTFGWVHQKETETVKREKERVSLTEGIGALVITATVLGLLAWVSGSLPPRRLPLNE